LSTEKAEAITQTHKLKTKPSLGKRLFHFLISMKLALTLLFVIAILSIIGTILPQGADVYETGWVKSPLFDFYKTLGLFDMYYSWWFLAVLGLLVVNLTVCIFNRLPTAVKQAFKLRVDVKDAFVANQPLAASFEGAGAAGKEMAMKLLRERHYRLHTGDTGSVLAQKGRFAGLASITFHLSFLFIAVGAVLGGAFGFSMKLPVPDGKTVQVPNTDLQVINHHFTVEYVGKAMLDDGRIVEVKEGEDGIVRRETNDGGRIVSTFDFRPSLYASDLEVFQNGQSIERKTIEVNDPLRLKGINFYQASFDQSRGQMVSILEVNHYPGKTLVYIGGFLMMGAITLALYFPRRRIWVKVGESGRLLIGGRTNRSKLGFKRDFERITTELRLRLGQEARADG